ncbi:hypothetical protein [Bradyrhizobium sp. 613_E4_N2_2]|uniref:hypothetical protein n=1 Tax=Bradyrhizobium sp. 613_E4_N2_2 TaxID=3240371 RepID=UPI003F8A2F34
MKCKIELHKGADHRVIRESMPEANALQLAVRVSNDMWWHDRPFTQLGDQVTKFGAFCVGVAGGGYLMVMPA